MKLSHRVGAAAGSALPHASLLNGRHSRLRRFGEGADRPVPLIEGGTFTCQINCMEDAPELREDIRFAICISLEVPVDAAIDVYGEIKDRLRPQVRPDVI